VFLSQSAPSVSPTARQRLLGWFSLIGWLFLLLPILFFGISWYTYAISIPKWDDHALRAFLFYSDQETSLTGKIYQLFRQHNEHRIVYDRLITKLDYWLFNQLSYTHLMIVGNLSLVGLLLLFMAIVRRAGRPILYATPVSLFLFNLSQWENMFWGMAALQNFSIVLWVLATFYFLSYTRQLGLAFILAVLATITSGNGLLVWPLSILIIALRLGDHPDRRRGIRQLIAWIAGSAIILALYFTGFEKPINISYVQPGPIDLLKGWFAVMGASAEAIPVSPSLKICVLIGGLLALTTFVITLGNLVRYWRAIKNSSCYLFSFTYRPTYHWPPILLFFWSCIAFLVGTTLIVAWARTGFGADLLITSRYKMYSLTIMVVLYVYLVATLNNRLAIWTLASGFIGGLAFVVISYLTFLNETIWWRHWLTTNQFNWTYPTNKAEVAFDPITQRYTPAVTAFYESALPVIFGTAQQTPIRLSVSKTAHGFSAYNTTMASEGLKDEGNYLVARSSKRTYLFPVWQNQQSIFRAAFLPSKLFVKGFKVDITTSDMQPDTYQLFVLSVEPDNKYTLYPTSQTIVTSGGPTVIDTKNW
jgi:hypothetical protein